MGQTNSKSLHGVISLHGRPKIGMKHAKLRSQFSGQNMCGWLPKNLVENGPSSRNLAQGKLSSKTWHKFISLDGGPNQGKKQKKQEVNFWARFVPIMTSQEISQKMSDEWKPKHDINQASKHGTRWYLGIPDLAKARNGQSLEVKFWLKFVPRISQELSRKQVTNQNLSTGKTKLWKMARGDIFAWGPSQGKKWWKTRIQFLAKICANDQRRT